ncbi:MAG: DUF2110 family protein [Candidatus Bathyarchaeia archaeon]
MQRVTLLEKVYGPISSKTLEPTLLSLCKGLKVGLKVVGETSRGWVQIEVSGEDETVALRYLDQRVGLAPASLDELKRFSTVRGKVVSSGKSRNELYVDIGVSSPRICDAAIPLQSLQAQLADGKKLPLQRIIELFCLYDHLPLEVKIVGHVDAQNERVVAVLSEAQLSQITRWIRSNLDRLIVLGALTSHVERAIKASKHGRDIIKIERLGLLEHAIVCKLGTQAIGLIPKLGLRVPTATLAPFCPRKIQQLTNRSFL